MPRKHKSMSERMIYWSDLLREARLAGSFFFEESGMRWFRSRLHSQPVRMSIRPSVVWFITSEQYQNALTREKLPRRWTVRLWRGKRIDEVGRFQAFKTSRQANEALRKIVAANAKTILEAEAAIGWEREVKTIGCNAAE